MEKMNDEPTYKKETKFIYDLPYEETQWYVFYKDHKNSNQGELQKHILKTKNDRNKWKIRIKTNPYEALKICQQIFYYSHYNKEKEEFETPSLLLRSNDIKPSRILGKEIFVAYATRQLEELKEVSSYYELKKLELGIEQNKHHKERANELTECKFCKSKITRTNLAKHIKNSKKCILIQKDEGRSPI